MTSKSAPERYYVVEKITHEIDAKPQYRVSVYNGEALLLSSLQPDENSRDKECRWWEEFGYERRLSSFDNQSA